MITTMIISVLVVSAIAALLAALLSVSEYFLANYGPCEITINKEKKITVEGGRSLLSSLSEQKLFIPSACGGRGTCGLCKLKIHEGAIDLLPTEEPFLTEDEKKSNVRLSCQVKVRNDMEIEIPDELFSIKEYKTRCAKIRDLTHDIKMFRFEMIEPNEIQYVAGKYIQLLTPKYEKNKEEVYRAYSMASNPEDRSAIELIIRLVPGGICTTYCFEYLKEGDPVQLIGPFGEFHLSDTDAEMIWVAGGSGMAPFVSMLHEMVNTNNQRKVTYFFGARKVKELFYLDEMKQFETQLPNFKFIPVVSSPDPDETWQGETGLVTEAVGRNIDNAKACEGYLCGSPGMIDASVKVFVDKLGMDQEKIFYDKFG